MNTSVKAFGTATPEAQLEAMNINRRDVTAKDVEIDILYCGVCHSDLHTARNEWGGTVYPNVPGHEIVGRITKVGSDVTKFKVGDLAGVGCMVDSCRECESCREGLEQYCEKGNIQTYNGHDKHLNQQTFGGYSERVVVDEDFVLRIPENLDLAATAPLPVAAFSLIPNRKSFAGSMIGGIAETQEMLDFCARYQITSDIEMIKMQDINKAYDRLLKGDVKYRFVIDMASLKN